MKMGAACALILAAAVAGPTQAQDGGAGWATAIATRPSDDHKMIYRYIAEFVPGFDRRAFPERVTLEWRYASETGLPARPEREAMDRFEDSLGAKLRDQGRLTASLVIVSTGEGVRRWTYYVKSSAVFMKDLSVVTPKSSAPIETRVATDPGWSSYETFISGVRR